MRQDAVRAASYRSSWIAAIRGLTRVWVGAALGLAACGPAVDAPAATCADCRRLVIAAVSEPPSVLPPLVQETVGRDVSAQLYERLLELVPGGAPMDSAAWRPALAERWQRPDDTTLVLTLRAGARWHDGTPLTADDVVFSYAAFADTTIGAPGLPAIGGLRVTALDARTVRVVHPAGAAEPLYDLAWGVRIVPKHIWGTQPMAAWAQDTALAHLVGSGPYRLVQWQRGEYLRLVADTTWSPRPALDTLVWRFSPSPDAAATLLLAHEADVMETLVTPPNVARVEADSTLEVQRYPSAVYGFLAFNVARGRHPVFGSALVRRALGLALDRPALATAILGAGTAVPQGPVSQALWLHDPARTAAPRDSAGAAALLDSAGWRPGADGLRQRAGTPLRVAILVPGTSASRRAMAEAVVAQWRTLGVAATIEVTDFPVFQQRLGAGRFETYIGSFLDEPSPRGLAVQWATSGIGQLNHGQWSDATFDSLLNAAAAARTADEARRRYRAALDRLEGEAPAVFLFTPVARLGRSRRVEVTAPVDPFSWLEGVTRWRKRPA